jgi:hypothetical protein
MSPLGLVRGLQLRVVEVRAKGCIHQLAEILIHSRNHLVLVFLFASWLLLHEGLTVVVFVLSCTAQLSFLVFSSEVTKDTTTFVYDLVRVLDQLEQVAVNLELLIALVFETLSAQAVSFLDIFDEKFGVH